MNRLGMLQNLRLVVSASALALALVACGDDDTPTFDARTIIDAPVTTPDARTFDARLPDARTADAGPLFSGTMALHDIRIFGVPQAGHGVQATIDFTEKGKPVVAYLEQPNPPVKCTVSIVDTTLPAQNNPTVNQGQVTFTRNGTAIPAPCNFSGGSYRCVFGGGAAGTIVQSTTNPAVGTFANSTFAFTAAHVGAYLLVASGAAMGSAWPIVGVDGMTAGLQKTSAAAFPAAVGMFVAAYGVGPIAFTDTPLGTATPGAPPDLLADDDTFTVQLTPGGGNNIPPYTSPSINAGDDFELDDDTKTVFMNGLDIYSDTDTVVGCSDTECPAPAAGLVVLVVSIETTDGTVGGGPTSLAPPTRFRASYTCPGVNANHVTITKEMKGIFRQANPKQMRISIFRDSGDLGASLTRDLSVVVGHGWVVFKDVPPPPT